MRPIFIPRTPATSNTNNIDPTATATDIIINQNPSNSSSNPPILSPSAISQSPQISSPILPNISLTKNQHITSTVGLDYTQSEGRRRSPIRLGHFINGLNFYLKLKINSRNFEMGQLDLTA
ncbi:unnamed protein product [Prunus armeniaca]|uniref:Uncharacterized protein n=1 Tax=Prunus armeniaca TaxID=36596 RepID=A0A6J5VRC3_PRUAR|nr:unnamed protein product [Prunus armeniaca]